MHNGAVVCAALSCQLKNLATSDTRWSTLGPGSDLLVASPSGRGPERPRTATSTSPTQVLYRSRSPNARLTHDRHARECARMSPTSPRKASRSSSTRSQTHASHSLHRSTTLRDFAYSAQRKTGLTPLYFIMLHGRSKVLSYRAHRRRMPLPARSKLYKLLPRMMHQVFV